MAVKVHRMCRLVNGIQDNADGSVGAEIVDIPLGIWVREVALAGQGQDGGVVVCPLGLVVHDPDMVAGCIGEEVHFDRLDDVGVRIEWLGEEGDGLVQVILCVWSLVLNEVTEPGAI